MGQIVGQGNQPREAKPDGWHVYHICEGQLREVTAAGTFGGDGFLLCVHCGERFETKVTPERTRPLPDVGPSSDDRGWP